MGTGPQEVAWIRDTYQLLSRADIYYGVHRLFDHMERFPHKGWPRS